MATRPLDADKGDMPARARRTLVAVVTILCAAALAAVPAVVGLVDNPSFSQQIPVQVPAQAQHPRPTTPAGGPRTPPVAALPSPMPVPSPTPRRATPSGTASPRHVEPGDDHSGQRGRSGQSGSSGSSGKGGGDGGDDGHGGGSGGGHDG
jgi:uncharacterized membrane protein YgcG